jgi:hypothetical protein
LYEKWLRWAWSGQVKELLAGLSAASERLGKPQDDCSEDDPRKVVADALGYVRNNRQRMDYPRYRRLGLPISSAGVESTIKRINRRVKASDKFWIEGGAEAMLQLRAAHLSEDGTAQRYWAHLMRMSALDSVVVSGETVASFAGPGGANSKAHPTLAGSFEKELAARPTGGLAAS